MMALAVPAAVAGGAYAIIGGEMRLHLSLRHRPTPGAVTEMTQTVPLFAAPELVDVRRPSSHERAELKRVSEHPPDIADASARATRGLADREQATAASPEAAG
jgi:hypothetical protein